MINGLKSAVQKVSLGSMPCFLKGQFKEARGTSILLRKNE